MSVTAAQTPAPPAEPKPARRNYMARRGDPAGQVYAR